MARKKSETVTTAEQGMTMILDTPVLKSVTEAADFVGVAEIRVLEQFSNALALPEAMGWEVIPQEYEHLLNEFKAQATNIQALPETISETVSEASGKSVEPIVDEPIEAPKTSSKSNKPKSGAMTKTRKESLDKGSKSSKKSSNLEQMATTTLAAQKGTRKGANLAAIELTAQEGAYQHVKKEGLKRQIAKLAKELEDEKNFDPQEVLESLGLPSLEDTENELSELVNGTLGKLGNVTEEILDNSWMNGLDLETELDDLQALLNLNE